MVIQNYFSAKTCVIKNGRHFVVYSLGFHFLSELLFCIANQLKSEKLCYKEQVPFARLFFKSFQLCFDCESEIAVFIKGKL